MRIATNQFKMNRFINSEFKKVETYGKRADGIRTNVESLDERIKCSSYGHFRSSATSKAGDEGLQSEWRLEWVILMKVDWHLPIDETIASAKTLK